MNRFTFLAVSLMLANAALAEMPQISDARIPLPPPGAPVAAGFLTIVNPDEQALVITGASSPIAEKVELHLSMVVDDVAKMQRQDELVVDPGATLTLEHGSYHLMFMGMNAVLAAGDQVAVTLDTSAGALDIVFPVGEHAAGSRGHADDGKSSGTGDSTTHEGMTHGDENQEMPPMEMPNSTTDGQ